ncbi:MAG: phospholipase D family protein [Gammaproteobacteria bacterium]|nr:phospholipase D family protein [Gammaproteobacteria bacterium]
MISTALSPEHTADTRLGRALHSVADARPGKAGFLPIHDGIDALAIRLLLADQAEHSIDTQYYEIEDDLAGRLFMEALLRAADRGVRIRLLLDDYRTKGHDKNIAALRAHPNFRMRIYNPFTRRSYRFVDGLLSFARVNRRMHNKSFTVDNQMTVIGGRNIGDHYFSVGHDVNFADLDVIGIGPIVADVSDMFDKYWNSPAAIPLSEVARRLGLRKVSISKLVDRMTQAHAEVSASKYADAIHSSMLEKLEHDLSAFVWAPYKLAFDLPEKTDAKTSKDAARIRQLLVDAFDRADREVILVSPYFVPRLSGVRRFRELRNRGVDVTVLTNSLASNNQVYAHGGYAPVRKSLLKMGVRLFELRADALVVGGKHMKVNSTKATLHTKAFAIDGEQLFIGSFNFDPRSANINTEMGVFIDSPELAEAFVKGARHHVPRQSYELLLDEKGALRWRGMHNDNDVILKREPQAGIWHRIAGRIARLLPIRGQV